ncbi:hypothetical protein OQA88_10304 [Cercophora sp. LCS_1]
MFTQLVLPSLFVGLGVTAAVGIRADFHPFSKFLDEVKQSTYKDFSIDVPSEILFLDAKQDVLSRYGGVLSPSNVKSFFVNDDYYDCIPFLEQPSVHLLKLAKENLTKPDDSITVPNPDAKDEFGNPLHCTNGTVPIARFNFKKAFKRLRLTGSASDTPLFPQSITNNTQLTKRGIDIGKDGRKHIHVWTHEEDPSGGITGASSVLNVWNPKAFLSFSYISLSAYPTAARPTRQFVAAGWAKFSGESKPKRFFYRVTNTNDPVATGCYSDTCTDFVQVGPFPVGQTYTTTSTPTPPGTQIEEELALELRSGEWRLYRVSGGSRTLVGYFPASIFTSASGALGTGSGLAQWIGEVADDRPDHPDVFGEMGSAVKPAPGSTRVDNYGKVAYQRRLSVSASSGVWRNANTVGAGSEDPFAKCYYIRKAEDQELFWGVHIFFGGKGGVKCDEP